MAASGYKWDAYQLKNVVALGHNEFWRPPAEKSMYLFNLLFQLFYLPGIRFIDPGTRVQWLCTRFHGIVGGYPESKTRPRTRPNTTLIMLFKQIQKR